MSRRHLILLVAVLAVAILARLHAEKIPVPNYSFESPTTGYVNVNIDSWQKSDKPDWYDESGGFFWSQLTGTFKNTDASSGNHIDNCESNQLIWLFADPEVALFQDYDSTDWRNQPPTHAFNATFEIGKSYDLTVGVMGGDAEGQGGNMLEGVPLEISLYCRDDSNNVMVVARTTVTNSYAVFQNHTHLVDFSVHVPAVRADDFWANRKIGIRFLSTVTTNMQGGYWDLDNVRLSSSSPPAFNETKSTNGTFSLTLQSEAGAVFDIVASSDFTIPASNWVTVATLTNTNGTIPFIDTSTNLSQRFYQARQRLP